MKKMLIATAVALTLGPAATAQQTVSGVNRADMDLSVKPGEDFYEYAGGGWMKANPLKPEYSSFGTFNVLAEANNEHLRDMFQELGRTNHTAGTVEQKVADLYKMAMDSDRLNREGAQPLQGDLAAVKAFQRQDLTPFLAGQHLCLGNPFFGIGVEADLKNSDHNVMWLSAGTSRLPDRDYYLKTDPESKKIQQAYRDYLTDMFVLAGYKKGAAKKAAQTIYNIEYKFAEASMDRAEARDYTKLYNIRTVEQLQKDYPAVNWKQYFMLMGVPNVDWVILTEPKVMAVANDLMLNLKEQEIRDYVSGEIITGGSGYLSDAFGDRAFEFSKLLTGQQQRKPRWKRALGIPNGLLGEAVGEIYVAKYFPPENKAKMLKLIGNLRKALATRIANLTWMSDETKIQALVKLNAFTVKVGYPDKWRDYTGLTVNPEYSLYDNIKGASRYETRRNLNKWNKPVDRDEWGMTPQTVNAYYNPTTNEICFPAAILQPPFFDVNADDATNYGAIGVVIGHEMTHGFDDQGRTFDKDGNMADWWTAEDAEKFTASAEKLAGQFDKIELAPGLNANGHLTLGENIADQGGLRISYDAFRSTQQFIDNQPLDGFTPAQRFYLSYGRIWAENRTDQATFMQTKADPHSIGRYRVNATLRNIDTFFDAFGIHEGDKMWLDPAERALVW